MDDEVVSPLDRAEARLSAVHALAQRVYQTVHRMAAPVPSAESVVAAVFLMEDLRVHAPKVHPLAYQVQCHASLAASAATTWGRDVHLGILRSALRRVGGSLGDTASERATEALTAFADASPVRWRLGVGRELVANVEMWTAVVAHDVTIGVHPWTWTVDGPMGERAHGDAENLIEATFEALEGLSHLAGPSVARALLAMG